MTIARPIVRPICRPILRSPLAGPRGDALTTAVKALFASGEKGVMFDLMRAANLYTDSDRTTLVSASGDRIGSVTDLSPNGKHASSSGTARPTWNSAGYGTFDSLDDYLQTAAIDFSGTDAVTVVVAARKSSDAAAASLVELSSNSTGANPGVFDIFAPAAASASYRALSRGTTIWTATYTNAAVAAPITNVLTNIADISADSVVLRVDGVQVASNSGDQGTGNYGNYPLYIGGRGGATLFFNGRIYRLLVIGRALTTTERNAAERWAAQPVGITIP